VSGALHHVRTGRGPALVLLAGLGSSGAAWAPVLGGLAGAREVWAVDLAGFGGSAPLPPGAPRGVPALADSIAAFLSTAGLERPHVAGNSLGGAVALELGTRGAVASVTALSPAGFANQIEERYATRSLAVSHALALRLEAHAEALLGRPRLRRLLYGQMIARADRLAPAEAAGHVRTLAAASDFRAVLDALQGWRFRGPLSAPGTIAWGTRDALLLPTQAHRARRRVPEAHHAWLPRCGHVPMSDEPALVTRVLLDGSAR